MALPHCPHTFTRFPIITRVHSYLPLPDLPGSRLGLEPLPCHHGYIVGLHLLPLPTLPEPLTLRHCPDAPLPVFRGVPGRCTGITH